MKFSAGLLRANSHRHHVDEIHFFFLNRIYRILQILIKLEYCVTYIHCFIYLFLENTITPFILTLKRLKKKIEKMKENIKLGLCCSKFNVIEESRAYVLLKC